MLELERGEPMASPLHQLKIIELGHVIAGPMSASLLSDFGADIIKVEAPGHDARTRTQGG